MTNVSGVIFFDLDDTLVNKTEFFNYAVKTSLQEVIESGFDRASLEAIVEEYLQIYRRDKNAQNHYDLLFSEYFEDENVINKYTQIAVETRRRIKLERYREYRYEKARKILEELIQGNFIIGIISDGVCQKQEEKLELLEINDLFDAQNIWITGKQEFEKCKGFYRDIYEKYSQRYKTRNIWMIGDREDKDITSPKRAGFKTIKVRGEKDLEEEHKRTLADYKIKTINDLDISVFSE